MSVRRAIVCSLWAVGLSTLALMPFRSSAAPPPAGDAKPTLAGPEVEVKFIDGSVMKVKLLDEKLELVTKHGTLQVAIADIKRVEFATRIPPADADKVRAAVQALGSPEHKVRQQASTDIKAVGPRAFGALLKATEHEDPEVAQRAEELVAFLKAKYTETQLDFRDKDVIHTDDSKLAGTLSAANLRIGTFQFGELRMKLADVYAIGDTPDEDDLLAANAAPAPTSMMAYANQFGKVLTFRVTGGQVPGMAFAGGPAPGMVMAGGTIWGTDQYTLDSFFPTAAVHAGVVQNGQTKTVRVKIVQSPNQFTGSNRNGVQSNGFGQFPNGAYEFLGKRKK
ncbi:LCCL domain-containing protein [Limnoglobus roseus]|uniref:LCCL domain-containing protein n=1 Tax=Limnoglobus roseus TaxID=2598579 RepID=A0A5C1ADM8_9BACT|nr:LCCL domain-containing protein [Limnoglobus roseus]QEL16277.1 hypothetical protein PX52LOC_03218 [Limnoglobus roseus]